VELGAQSACRLHARARRPAQGQTLLGSRDGDLEGLRRIRRRRTLVRVIGCLDATLKRPPGLGAKRAGKPRVCDMVHRGVCRKRDEDLGGGEVA
jgi:hypothetical protein